MKQFILTLVVWFTTGITLTISAQIVPINQNFSADTVIKPVQ
jgi:hypothetical protein